MSVKRRGKMDIRRQHSAISEEPRDYGPLTTGLRTDRDRDRDRARKEKDSRQGAEWGIGTPEIDKPVLTRIR